MDNIEDKAREMGWVDEDAWVEQGKPQEQHRDAEAFMEYGESNAKFVRKSLEKDFEAKLSDANKGFEDRLARVERTSTEALKRQKEKLNADHKAEVVVLKTRRREAAAENDTEAVLKVTEEIEALNEEHREAPVQNVAASQATESFNQKFMPLLMASAEVKTFSDVSAATISRDNPNMPAEDFYKELEQQITEEFSEKGEFARFFGKPVKRESKVDSSDNEPTPSDGNSWSDIPDADRALASEFIADGLFKNKADYANKYWEQG